MSECVISSDAGLAERTRYLAMASQTGSKVFPIFQQRCEACGTFHQIKLEGPQVEYNYRAPIQVDMTQSEVEADRRRVPRQYCGDCRTWHGVGEHRESKPLEAR